MSPDAAPSGCATFEVRLAGKGEVEVVPVTRQSCGPVQPVAVGRAEFDRARKIVRLPLALENHGEVKLRAPARLYGWEDSLAVLSPPGLAQNRHQGDYLSFVAADSVAAAAGQPRSLVWRFDGLLAPDSMPQVLAPGARSRVRWIEVSVHAGVQRFRLTVAAEARRASSPVPAVAPDTIPESIYDPANLESDSPLLAGTFVRNVVVVLFQPGTSQEARQAAIDLIGGEVIGGSRITEEDGDYYVRIEDDGTAGPLLRAIEQLEALPQVMDASPEFVSEAEELLN